MFQSVDYMLIDQVETYWHTVYAKDFNSLRLKKFHLDCSCKINSILVHLNVHVW